MMIKREATVSESCQQKSTGCLDSKQEQRRSKLNDVFQELSAETESV